MLKAFNLIPQDTLNWLNTSGIIDSDGDPYISRRWGAILTGATDNGYNQLAFWKLVGGGFLNNPKGFIPNSMLPYNLLEAIKWITKSQFNNDYFNPSVITPDMYNMGKEFAKRFSIQAENIAKDPVTLQTYLREGSIHIGIPVPQDGSWNRQFVDYPKGRTVADHAIELYKYDPTQKYPYYIYDSYEPHLKQLSADYFIAIATRVRVWPNPVLQTVPLPVFQPWWMSFWMNVKAYITGQPLPFPRVPVGFVNG